MHVYRSNRVEALVEVLAEVVAHPVAGVCAPECIVVQGKGMERWLSMELARRLGVWANPDFPFPRSMIVRALDVVLGEDEAYDSSFEPETLLWSIADLLPHFLRHHAFAPVCRYLEGREPAPAPAAHGDRGGAQESIVRRIQLAARIADIFDQYVVYRPDMVLDWQRGTDEHWQAVLWRALVERHGSKHVAARASQFLAVVGKGGARPGSFPARVSLFGVSTLPPLYLEILAALSRLVEVHLFLLSPSREYWAEIRSRRDIERLRGTRDAGEALHLEEGNPLLASLGRLGRDFQELLEDGAHYREDERDLYRDPSAGSMLAAIQSDILHLRQRGAGNTETPPLPLDPDDASISLHACHSPMREVEVLHDQLLALFDADPTLEPREVVVMSPAIDRYAPFIDAVFGGAADHHPRIPYRIADRRVRSTDDVIDAFLRLMGTLRGRMTASEVLDLLGVEPIRERFGILAGALDLLRTWVKESGIRWGTDADHRESVGQPRLLENTWRFGLDRLLLGYAMPGEGRRLYQGVLPYDDIEGTSSELLGRLAEFSETLFGFQRSLHDARPLGAWQHDLGRLLEAMVASTSETADQHHQVRMTLADLAVRAAAGEFREPVDLDTVELQLTTALERSAPGRGFLTGGVTFCALVPMRSIPFRVVCLLGMNDADFPRARRPPGFDLMAQSPRRGDRSARDDDRYLFLEALLSARESLLITYVGQSIQDNSEVPPSVVISELLDTLGDSFEIEEAAGTEPDDGEVSLPRERANAAIRRRLVTRHPLQPFSPSYFVADPGSRLFSYAANCCEGTLALTGERTYPPLFVPAPLSGEAATREVTLDQLVRFFENPARAFLQNRLALFLGDDVEMLADREPLELAGLERWKVGSDLVQRLISGEVFGPAMPSVRASGALPPGVLGDCVLGDLEPEVAAIAARAVQLRGGKELDAFVIDEQLDGTRISGVLRNLWPNGHVLHHFSKPGRQRELGTWILHLVLNWQRPETCPSESLLIGRANNGDGAAVIRFRPVDDAARILRELLNLYWLGQTMPLLLFGKASRVYVDALRRPKNPLKRAEALRKARAAYEENEWARGDLDDEYVKQVFGTHNPLDPSFRFGGTCPPSFTEVALIVLGAMLEHREELP